MPGEVRKSEPGQDQTSSASAVRNLAVTPRGLCEEAVVEMEHPVLGAVPKKAVCLETLARCQEQLYLTD